MAARHPRVVTALITAAAALVVACPWALRFRHAGGRTKFLRCLGVCCCPLLRLLPVGDGSVPSVSAPWPALARVLNALGLSSVFAAPWFAAIYLLLFTSLAGCVLPRTARLARSARALPPPAPRHLSRLPCAARYETGLAPGEAVDAAAAVLGRRR